MKNFALIFLTVIFFSCSSSDDEPVNNMNIDEEMTPISSDDFTTTLNSEANSLAVDEEIEVNFSSSEPIEFIEVATNKFMAESAGLETVLTDENNTIILLGSPVDSEVIKELYTEKIKELVNR